MNWASRRRHFPTVRGKPKGAWMFPYSPDCTKGCERRLQRTTWQLLLSGSSTDLSRGEEDVRRVNAGIQIVVRLSVDSYRNYQRLPLFINFMKSRTEGINLQIMSGARCVPLQVFKVGISTSRICLAR